MKRVAVFGSTGAIGRRTLEVIDHLKDEFRVTALIANQNAEQLAEQARRYKPRTAVVVDRAKLADLEQALGKCGIRAAAGPEALIEVAARPSTDIVVMALSGTRGLEPTLAALEKGKRVAIATKEIIVGFGRIVMERARRHNAEILPIDSELSAIHQCLEGNRHSTVSRIILTASGGPFHRRSDLSRITVKQALRHPTWSMGRKITVDSATLMNKGLEAIETAIYFGVEPEKIEVLIHPQSIVHSFVEFCDGSMLAQLAVPDMRLPIQYALTYPARRPGLTRRANLAQIGRLTFRKPDLKRFPGLALAMRALREGGVLPCVLNVANEIAVQAFLEGELEFHEIPHVVARVLEGTDSRGDTTRSGVPFPTLEDLRRYESLAHDLALGELAHLARGQGGIRHKA
jgi:1-deoxy-D-xylulose-5-phosphate reductoisomerase